MHSTFKRLRERSIAGFSFIELVIVVAVIGILTAIAIPAYGFIQQEARINSVASGAQTAYTKGLVAAERGESITSIEDELNAQSSSITYSLRQSSEGLCASAQWSKASDNVASASRGECGDEQAPEPGSEDMTPRDVLISGAIYRSPGSDLAYLGSVSGPSGAIVINIITWGFLDEQWTIRVQAGDEFEDRDLVETDGVLPGFEFNQDGVRIVFDDLRLVDDPSAAPSIHVNGDPQFTGVERIN